MAGTWQIRAQVLGEASNGAGKAPTRARIVRRLAMRVWPAIALNIGRAAFNQVDWQRTGMAPRIMRSAAGPRTRNPRFLEPQIRSRNSLEARANTPSVLLPIAAMAEASQERVSRAIAAAHFPEGARERNGLQAPEDIKALVEAIGGSEEGDADEN